MANSSLMEALDSLAKEKNIPKELILKEIQNALEVACKQSYKNTENISVLMNFETGE